MNSVCPAYRYHATKCSYHYCTRRRAINMAPKNKTSSARERSSSSTPPRERSRESSVSSTVSNAASHPPAGLMTKLKRRKGPRRTPATSALSRRSWCWSSSATILCCEISRWLITGGKTRSGRTRPSWWRRHLTSSRAGSGHCVTLAHALTRRRAVMVPLAWLRGRSGSSPSLPSWSRSLATVLSPSRV